MRRTRAVAAICSLLLLALAAQARAAEAPGSELTNSGGDLRTGWYPNEPSITPELVSGGTFGRLWSTPVKGQAYGQPLLDDGTLFIATEENNLYGLNPATGAQQWTKNLGEPWNPGEIKCGDLAPSIGATATPVIDPETNVAYFTYKTYHEKAKEPEWFMDAVDVSNGAQQPGFPVQLDGTAQNASGQTFHPKTELQRPGLLLMEGVVYAAFGSDCDTPPWEGWVFGVSTAGAVKARWVSDETAEGAGIWQSGAGLTSDRPGSILLSTGNGGAPSTPALGDEPPPNLGESIVRLNVQADGTLKAVDFFAPYNASYLDTWDADFASGGVTGLPEEYFGTLAIPHLAVAVGKSGYVYLLNRDNLGGIGEGPSGSDDVVQRIGPYGGVWSRPAVWPGEGGWVYIPTASGGSSASGSSGSLDVYQYGLSGTGTPTLSRQASSSEAFGFSSSAPVITSNGTAEGSALVWIVWAPNAGGEGAQLRAYNPIPVDGQPVLRFSAPVGTSAKFALPGVGAGRLYVGTRDGHVLAFGSPVTPILTGSATTFPTTTVGQSSEKTLTLTATEPLTLSTVASSSSQFTLGTPSSPLPAALATGQTIKVPITFSPTGTGPIGATLTATTSTSKTATFALSGIGQSATAKLEATPPLLTFEGTIVGETESAGATFRNVGGAPLTINAVHLPSAPFAASGVPTAGSTIAPGHSVTITVNFEPKAIGTFNDEIGLETTAGNAAVGLSGSAGAAGTLQITNEVNEYGPVPLGSSESKSFTIENVGGSAVTLTKSKPPSGGTFAATTSLPEGTTIKPGESLTETVKFTPTTTGPASAVWQINGEKDTNGLQEVKFSGEGVAPPALTASTKSLELGAYVGEKDSGKVTFTNTGGTTLEIKALHTPSAPFAVTGMPAQGATIKPGEKVTVEATFTPTGPGEFPDSLSLTTEAGETKVSLAGFSVEPPALTPSAQSLELGAVFTGESRSAKVTFTNTGGTTLEVKALHAPLAPFAATGIPAKGTKLKPGAKLTVEVTFKPTGSGEFLDSLSLTTEAGETNVDLSGSATAPPALRPSTPSLELGSTLVGEKRSGTVKFTNTGGTTLEVKALHAPAAPFEATGMPSTGTKLNPGEAITVEVDFDSATPGTFKDSLSLTTQAGESKVPVSATALAPPALTPSTTSLELGSAFVGEKRSGNVTFTNTGGTTLEVKALHAPSAPFAVTGMPAKGAKLKPGEKLTVEVTFKPTGSGEFLDSLSLTTEAGETSVELSGTALEPPALTPSTKSLELGTDFIGEEHSGKVTFTNTGGTTLEVKALHAPSAPFAATGMPATGTKLAPGEAVTITINFDSASPGSFNESVSLTTEAGETKVALSATAIALPALTPSPTKVELGPTIIGHKLTSTVKFKNTGGTTLEVEALHNPSAPFSTTGMPAKTTKIAPGEEVPVEVAFQSATPGEFHDTLSLTTKAGPTTVDLSGTATEPAPASAPGAPTGSLVTTTSLISPIGATSPFIAIEEPPLNLTKLQIRAKTSKLNPNTHRFVVTYTLSGTGEVELAVYRRLVSHHCQRGVSKCDRWILTNVKLTVAALLGSNSLTLNLTALAAGDYRLQATPTTHSGLSGITQYLRFKMSG